jgi:AcrR family transcriptional regulator
LAGSATAKERREERQQQIIRATIRVLSREGITEATTRNITAEAGVNGATLHYYFGSKDELFWAVLQELSRQGEEVIRAAVRTDQGLYATIESCIRAFWLDEETTPELQTMQYELTLYALRRPESAWLARKQYEAYCDVLETVYREASERSQEPCAVPFADLARFTVSSTDGILLRFLVDHDATNARRDLDRIIALAIAMARGDQIISAG